MESEGVLSGSKNEVKLFKHKILFRKVKLLFTFMKSFYVLHCV